MFKNKEIAATRKTELEKDEAKALKKTDVSAEDGVTEPADTERQLISNAEVDKTDPSIDPGAQKASRVKPGDQSVVQDDEDFSDEN